MSQTSSKTVSLYVIEEQEIYREVYKVIFPAKAESGTSNGATYPIDLLGVSNNGKGDISNLRETVSALRPNVLLLSTKKLQDNIVETLEQIREHNPEIGIALFLVFYSAEDIELLRKLALSGTGGMALFLKQSLDLTEQLYGIVIAVNQGQVILDPTITTLLFAGKKESPFLKQLTTRELEILSLLSKGYTNAAIAETLYIDVKTVEHHINSMYSKLKANVDFNHKHSRVSAARLYLEAIGELSTPTTALKTVPALSPAR